MAIEVTQSEVFEAVYEAGVVGLAGNLAVAINDNQNNNVYGPTTLQIIELTVGGNPIGTYRAMLTAPADLGQFSINWSNDGSFDPDHGGAVEDLIVGLPGSFGPPSIGLDLTDSALCNAWTTSEDVALCCNLNNVGSDTTILDWAVIEASELLYEASGRQFPGECERTVRPCRGDSCLFGIQVLSRGHLVGWTGWRWDNYECGCTPTSRVKLSGRVKEILEVRVDGVVLDPSQYFLQGKRWLIRRSPHRWPVCQTIGLPDTEPGTWSVTYSYGKNPPVIGQGAARALACEIVKSCTPGAECLIPPGATRITRQGITFERSQFMRLRSGPRLKGQVGVFWQTGIQEVDFFLNGINPNGIPRRATFWSPSSRNRYARPDPV